MFARLEMQEIETNDADGAYDTASGPHPAWVKVIHDRGSGKRTQRLCNDPVEALRCHITGAHIRGRQQGSHGLAGGNHEHLTQGN